MEARRAHSEENHLGHLSRETACVGEGPEQGQLEEGPAHCLPRAAATPVEPLQPPGGSKWTRAAVLRGMLGADSWPFVEVNRKAGRLLHELVL